MTQRDKGRTATPAEQEAAMQKLFALLTTNIDVLKRLAKK